MSPERILDATLKTTRTLFFALVATPIVFAFVSTRVPPASAPLDHTLLVGLLVVPLGPAIASFLIPAQLQRAALARSRGARPEPGTIDPRAPSGDPLQAARKAAALFQTRLILELALSEAVGIFGLVIKALGGPMTFVLPLFGAAFVLMALRFPTRDALDALARDALPGA